MRFAVRYLFLTMALAVIIGCAPSSIPVEQPNVAAKQAVETNLQMAAESGQVGSEMMEVQQKLEEMKATDSALATELLADLEELQAMSNPEQVKAKAKEMIGKLAGEGAAEE